MRFIIFYIFLLISAFGCKTSKLLSFDSIVAYKKGNEYYLKSGKFNIGGGITLPSNISLIGNNTFLTFDNNTKFPFFIIQDAKDVTLKKINFIGAKMVNTTQIEDYSKYNVQYILHINRSSDVKVESCLFQNSYGSVIQISDANKIVIKENNFKDIGISTTGDGVYSYDAIFVGGYNKTSMIKIVQNVFENIGSLFPALNYPWPNDGDGIQVQCVGEVDDVLIKENKFIKCASRGVKIQTGTNIAVINNSFSQCRSGVNLAMAKDLKNIELSNNLISNCWFAFGSDSSSPGFTANGLKITSNIVTDSCEHFFRSSGYSKIHNCTISDNKIEQVGTYFIDGRFTKSIIENNIIEKYCTYNNPSDNMAMFIEPESDNLIVRSNYFGKSKGSKQEILNRGKGKITIENNILYEIGQKVPENIIK